MGVLNADQTYVPECPTALQVALRDFAESAYEGRTDGPRRSTPRVDRWNSWTRVTNKTAGVLAPAVGYIVARADGPAGQPALRSTMRRAGAFATSLRDAAALR